MELSSLAPPQLRATLINLFCGAGDLLFPAITAADAHALLAGVKMKQIPRSANQIDPEWKVSLRREG